VAIVGQPGSDGGAGSGPGPQRQPHSRRPRFAAAHEAPSSTTTWPRHDAPIAISGPLPGAWGAPAQPHGMPFSIHGDLWVLRGCSDAIDQVTPIGTGRTPLRHQLGRTTIQIDGECAVWTRLPSQTRTLNPRVRGSSPWRRTRSDLGVLPIRKGARWL